MKKMLFCLGIIALVLTGCGKSPVNTQGDSKSTQQTQEENAINEFTSSDVIGLEKDAQRADTKKESTPSNITASNTPEAGLINNQEESINKEDSQNINSRDTKRLADIKQLVASLELFEFDNKFFPKSLIPGESLWSPNKSVKYIEKIPSNPKPWEANGCPNKDYEYTYNSKTKDYVITFCLENDNGNFKKGINIATSTGLVETKISSNIITEVTPIPTTQNNSRDQKRLSDMKQLFAALDLYFNENNEYPKKIVPGEAIQSTDGVIIYMPAVPSNPKPRTDKGCPDQDYIYTYKSSSEYTVEFCIGMSTGNLEPGKHFVRPTGIQ